MNLEVRRRLLFLLAAISLASPFGAFAQDATEWITVNKNYSSQRYVDLDQINQGNVNGLKPVCEARLNEPSWFSSGLLMVGRTIYVSTLRATYAVDAATCEVRWRDVIKLGPTANISNRGPGYLDGTIFRGTADGRVIALDAKTGKVLWDQKHADPAQNESFVAAPPGTVKCSSASPSAIWACVCGRRSRQSLCVRCKKWGRAKASRRRWCAE